jgi:hypothetical protein
VHEESNVVDPQTFRTPIQILELQYRTEADCQVVRGHVLMVRIEEKVFGEEFDYLSDALVFHAARQFTQGQHDEFEDQVLEE